MKIQKKQEIEFFGTKTGNANSIALGYATETKNFGEVAVGVMNKSTAAKDPNSPKGVCADSDATLFSVGCGGSGERKNALEVKGDGSVIIPGENGNINIADKIKQAFDTDASIELVKSAEDSLQYTLMVNNEARGSINIPKDQFLKNVTYDSEGKKLVFTFVTLDEDEHVEKVPVGDLKDIYTAGEGITINGDNVISADFSSVMTAISDEKTQRETADNEIKSTLDTKADVSAIPTKLSQLTNDSFPTPDDIAIFAGLIIHNNARIRYIQKSGGSEGTYLIAEVPADRVANKVFAADGSLFDVSKLVKNVQCNVSRDPNNVEFGYTTVDGTYNFSVIPTVTTNHSGIMTAADKVKLDKLQKLVELKIVGTSESSVAMKPNKVYEITVGSALTITLEEPTDKTVYNEYQGTFDTGDTIPTVTFPSNVRWNDTPKVGANQHVEFSIRYSGGKYYGICQVWDMTKQ